MGLTWVMNQRGQFMLAAGLERAFGRSGRRGDMRSDVVNGGANGRADQGGGWANVGSGPAPAPERLTLRDYINVVWRRKWIVVLVVVRGIICLPCSTPKTAMARRPLSQPKTPPSSAQAC